MWHLNIWKLTWVCRQGGRTSMFNFSTLSRREEEKNLSFCEKTEKATNWMCRFCGTCSQVGFSRLQKGQSSCVECLLESALRSGTCGREGKNWDCTGWMGCLRGFQRELRGSRPTSLHLGGHLQATLPAAGAAWRWIWAAHLCPSQCFSWPLTLREPWSPHSPLLPSFLLAGMIGLGSKLWGGEDPPITWYGNRIRTSTWIWLSYEAEYNFSKICMEFGQP